MKIYTWPRVAVIARPHIIMENVGDFLEGETGMTLEEGAWVQDDEAGVMDGDSLPEFCGRMCYVSFGKKQGKKTNESYIQNIVAQGHGSVLEHSNWTFLVTRASRGFTHEMVRHRSGFAYSQESTHYIDYSLPENWSICIDPRLVELEPDYAANMESAAVDAFRVYARVYSGMVERGMKKKEACSIARQILPTGIESKLCFTANARALRHFVEYRGHSGNVLEIRAVAIEVLKLMKVQAPNIFKDVDLQTATDGYDEVVSAHRKV